MTEYFETLLDPDFVFLRYAAIMGLLASVAFGTTGSFVVVKRISYLAGAIAHAVLGGVGFALYAEYHWGWAWFSPFIGALFSGLLAAVLIGWIRSRGVEREDSLIGAIWATGMGIGLFFISAVPGTADPMAFLFGNILLLSLQDLLLVFLLDVVLVVLVIFGYPKLQAVCFDEEFARLRGIPTGLYTTFLLCLVAVAIVLLVHVVGVILVVALLTLPAATVSRGYRSLWQMMIASSLLTAFVLQVGLALSFLLDLPTGATIVLTASTFYLVSRGFRG